MKQSQNQVQTQKHFLQRTVAVCLLAMVCCLLWGSAFPCIKIGYEMFAIGAADTASQILFAGVRFTLAGVLVVLIYSIAKGRLLLPKKTSWGMIGTISAFQTVLQYLFFYIGLAHTTGVKGSIIEASHVFFAILFASLIFHQEKLDGIKGIGCVIGFAGVVLINLTGSGLGGGVRFNGEGFLVIACMAYAMSSVLIKNYSQREDPVIISGYQFILGGIVMIAVALLAGGRLGFSGPAALLLMVYMAMISAVAYSLWGLLLKYNPVSKVSVFGFMTPVFGMFLSAVLLGEGAQMPWLQSLAALILVCAGIYIVNRK